jgi:hypothetical protein
VEYEVQAFSVPATSAELPLGTPWTLKLEDVAARTYSFLVNVDDEIFRSTTLTPLDALLAELAYRTLDFLKAQVSDVSFARVLADLRREYCADSKLDPREIIARATSLLEDFGLAAAARVPAGAGDAFFAEFTEGERASILRRMATRGVADHKATIASGRFLEYAEPAFLRAHFRRHPEMFFDGEYWDDAYAAIDFGAGDVNEEARGRVRARFDAFFADALWLSERTPNDLERANRDSLIRATCSLRLLRPDVDA